MKIRVFRKSYVFSLLGAIFVFITLGGTNIGCQMGIGTVFDPETSEVGQLISDNQLIISWTQLKDEYANQYGITLGDSWLHQWSTNKEAFLRRLRLLQMTLTTVQQYHDGGYPALETYLKHLGVVHERKNVPMETYPHWRAAMLHTLAKLHGPDWNRQLSAEWGLALDGALRVMLHGIEERGKS